MNGYDVLSKVADSSPVKIRMNSQENRQLNVVSSIADVSSDKEILRSYLAMIKEGRQIKIYCQLPVTEDISKNPVSRKLFINLLDMAISQAGSEPAEINEASVETIDHNNKIGKE